VDKTRWLLHIDFFCEISLKESVIDIKLVHWSAMCKCYGEDNFDCLRFYHRCKCFFKVYVGCLSEAFCN